MPFRRGAQRSRPLAEILDEVRRFRDEGAREIILLGQIVNAYGFDLDGTALPDVLEAWTSWTASSVFASPPPTRAT